MVLRALLVVLVILLPAGLLAHEGPGPRGGARADAGPYLVELVAGQGQIKVFIYSDTTTRPESVKDAKATATVLVGQQREVVTLAPDAAEKDGNLLAGKLTLPAGKGTRVVVQLQMPGQPAVVARFVL
jgi:hypothetical protein